MRHRPIFWCSAALAAGLLDLWPDMPARAWTALAGAALAGTVALAASSSRRATLALAAGLALAGFLCVGRALAIIDRERPSFDIGALVEAHPRLFGEGVDLEGRLAGSRPLPARAAGGEDMTEVLLDVTGVTARRRRIPAIGRIRLTLPGPSGAPARTRPAAALRGHRVTVFARLWPARTPGNPGAFNARRYLRARGISAIGSVKASSLLLPVNACDVPTGIAVRIDNLRDGLLRAIRVSFPREGGGPRAAAVAAALLLGERSGLDPEDNLALQEAGLAHLLAVSGFNVAVLAAVALLLFRLTPLSGRWKRALLLPILLVYLLLNRDESSVARAVVMASVYLAGRIAWRRPDALNSLGLAAALILARSPSQIHDAGFQLTFVATASLIASSSIALQARRTRREKPRANALRWVAAATAATIAATAATLPLTALHFNRVTPGAIPANLVAGPLMAGAFVGTLAIEATAPISDTASRAIARAVTWMVDSTFRTATVVRRIPWMTYRRATPGWPLVTLYGLALAGVFSRATITHPGASRSRPAAPLAALTVATVFLLAPMDTRVAPRGLRLTSLDVGQGDATLIEAPGGQRILVDAGGGARNGFDVGERIVSRALWSMGIARIDTVVVTHADADHAGGAPAVVRNFRPREIWLPRGTARSGDRDVTRLEDAARETDAKVVEIGRGESRCLIGACVAVLHPASASGHRAVRGRNEDSLVLRIGSAGRAALLMGDAGRITEKEIVSSSVAADVVKIGHHGSRTASSEAFLVAVAPRLALVSSGAANRFGHPHPEVLRRLERTGALVCRTDLDGATEVTLTARGTVVGGPCRERPRRGASDDPARSPLAGTGGE